MSGNTKPKNNRQYAGFQLDTHTIAFLDEVATTLRKPNGKQGSRSDAARSLIDLGYRSWRIMRTYESFQNYDDFRAIMQKFNFKQ